MNDDAAYLSIIRLQHAYGDIATRRAWSEAAALAIPEARFFFDTQSGDPVEVVGAKAWGEFAAQVTGGFSFLQYIPLNAVVRSDGPDSARGRAYALEIGEDRDSREWINFYGLYHDDYVLFDGAWRFARRHYQPLARRTGHHLEAFPLQDREL